MIYVALAIYHSVALAVFGYAVFVQQRTAWSFLLLPIVGLWFQAFLERAKNLPTSLKQENHG